MASRELTDGCWDSWTYSPTFNFASFAENPIAAPAPFLLGDFNNDGRVDAGDYGIWRSAFGSTVDLAADANRDGTIDAADYAIWRKHFDASAASATGLSIQIPESWSATMALCSLCPLWQVRLRRKEKIS